MKYNRYTLTIVLAATSFACGRIEAERIASPVMGFVKQRTVVSSDTVFGLPMHATPAWAGAIANLSGSELTLEASLDVGALTAKPHYLQVITGDLKGYRFDVTANTATTVMADPNTNANLEAQGLKAGDAIKVIPFWTLGTLFPGGEGIVPSTDPYSPACLLRSFNAGEVGTDHLPTTSYLYYGGNHESVAKGWYDINDFAAGLQDDVPLSPETHIIIRNGAGAAEDFLVQGQVPTTELGTAVGRFEVDTIQDNLVINPYPVDITLGAAGLIENGAVEGSPDPYNPTDLVRFLGAPSGYDPLPTSSYLYYSGDAVAKGWYDINDFGAGLQDGLRIPAGGAFIIRKGRGAAGTVMWLPKPPYNN